MIARAPDPDSLRYAHYWEPVLAAAGERLLDRVSEPPGICLDLGAGTGALTLAAAGRWPQTRLIALDASAGMLSVARQRLSAASAGHGPDRCRWLAADALDIPLEDDSVDLVVSSFVLQLVDDRRALLSEVARVLRAGGTFGFVTWLATELRVGADEAWSAAKAELGLGRDAGECRPARVTDYASLEEARAELRASGFIAVEVERDELCHAWSREGYLEFKERYDDHELVDTLDDAGREQLRTAARATLHRLLPDADFEVRGPLVSAIAHVP